MIVGVANPKAQGHAITRTVTAAIKPCTKPLSAPNIHHITKVNNAITITVGTKTAAILSTNFCTGAYSLCVLNHTDYLGKHGIFATFIAS
jgi:hypothetical protein